MAKQASPKIPSPELDPIIRTRQEALGASLRPGGHLDQARAYSTLFERPDGDQDGPDGCAYCDSLMSSIVHHLNGHEPIRRRGWSYRALRAALDTDEDPG